MLRKCASTLALSIAFASPAMADIYSFIETSCFPDNCSPAETGNAPAPILPAVEAQFTEIDSSGTYGSGVYQQDTGLPPPETGDPNFYLNWGNQFYFSGSEDLAPENLLVTWDGPNIDIKWYDENAGNQIDLQDGSGSIGSDNYIAGCGGPAQCEINGYWVEGDLPIGPITWASASARAVLLGDVDDGKHAVSCLAPTL